MILKIFIIQVIVFSCFNLFSQDLLNRIEHFGENPGNLRLNTYIPENIPENSPLVVVLHGCTQSANSCAEQTGWIKLAEQHKFCLLFPEQIILNNVENCFSWFRKADQEKDKGEPASIMNMINYIKQNYSIDSSRIFITGLSAGGAMSVIMMALFPNIFNKGAVLSGCPYKSATSAFGAYFSMIGLKAKSPEKWGNLVRNENPDYKGKYPEIAVFHGTRDFVNNYNNSKQLIKQWTNLHNTDSKVDNKIIKLNGNDEISKFSFKNSDNKDVVVFYKFKKTGHTLPIDTGSCPNQGGKTGMFASDKDFHSTFEIADFFEILKAPYQIQGNVKFKKDSQEIYSVPKHSCSTYNWNLPEGSYIVNGRNSSSVEINLGKKSGFVEVIETDSVGCKNVKVELFLEVY
ncbi:MAG: hypothetical protein A2046_07700 [Bacteroidetes bacterium GWA2_30_7]|nr:MAG: hypothetical protein A2046_07700 [Bacteroidetes bacterium GWA2_30_7]